jgi:hypothetical protein
MCEQLAFNLYKESYILLDGEAADVAEDEHAVIERTCAVSR